MSSEPTFVRTKHTLIVRGQLIVRYCNAEHPKNEALLCNRAKGHRAKHRNGKAEWRGSHQ